MNLYFAGIDIGSTTVKLVLRDENGNTVFSDYRRHFAHIQETLASLLADGQKITGECTVKATVTGSGSISLAKNLGIPFVQEVVAVATALEDYAPQTDVAIELGGEDAKIIYFTGGIEQRMNGVCAGGTGSFIDQMAALLQTDAAGLNEYAKDYREIYRIAARCGVFAKSDIQPLINEGATREDLSASIFQAVVNQTISGLACGKPIRGNVAFLGGPLHFLSELKEAFIRTLKLSPDQVIAPDNSHLFAAGGAAMCTQDSPEFPISELIGKLSSGVSMDAELKRMPALFVDNDDYESFRARHAKHIVKRGDIASYSGDCYLGIDAGSTTTKLALVAENGDLLYSFYSNNNGSPIKTAILAVKEIRDILPKTAHIAGGCSTGYGEALLKSAFMLDFGEVETIAHYRAAEFFEPDVDCIMDIGGQDMKCIKIKNNSVDTIMLNEACSSGCGSFIENFANSLGYTAQEFAKLALYAKNPIDLGTRCTVFMNSNVKQAQKEGATVEDISAGLAYSVIKNALFKVIKLTDASALGKHIVVQGGTFLNHAVLRAFENISGVYAVCPDISGIMGAFGAALIARDRHGETSTMLSLDEIVNLTYSTSLAHCGRCTNNCLLTINKFPGDRRYITGNRCENGLAGEKKKEEIPNIYDYKLKRIFACEPLDRHDAKRGVIGLPRVLNMYENYPFWATFFKALSFSVKLSPLSTRGIYELGIESIPSESECYPAKLAHGHIQWLINNGVKTIFYPCVFYERKENPHAQNHFNCPIVVSYPENIKNNVEGMEKIHYIRPFIAFTDKKTACNRLVEVMKEEFDIPESEVKNACALAWSEMLAAKQDVLEQGKKTLEWMEKNHRKGIVLAGRPYHIDPEINHGIPQMINSYGLAVLSEDSVADILPPEHPLRATDQWTFHSRLYRAAEYVKNRDDLELVQLNSFGCGIDAVTTDQVDEILSGSGKLYTLLKIDEVNNLGAARIRIRSLIAAMRMRREKGITRTIRPYSYHRKEFTAQMRKKNYTILAPQMSPIHFGLVSAVFNNHGYNVEILGNDNRHAIDTGLKYVNNDACFPSLTVVGQIMDAVMSGKYNTKRLAVVMTQTGGCCRASNYVGFIRRALEKAGYPDIPVISLNVNGMEKNSGFKISLSLLLKEMQALIFGDLFMRCLYRVRPYELEPGSANKLHKYWENKCIEFLTEERFSMKKFGVYVQRIVDEFDALAIDENLKKPRVGIVGEILVKYMPLANNHLVELLESEGAEAVVPDMLGFLEYCFYNNSYKYKYLGGTKKSEIVSNLGIKFLEYLRRPVIKALASSNRFDTPEKIENIAEMAKPLLSIGNQYGEGWFLAGEMVELIHSGVPNIVCIQPFACLPNHVVGKGVIKKLQHTYKQANIAAVDYDPGASEVNQLNRIKLMLSTAKKNLKKYGEEEKAKI